ncbi:AEC family transporter [Nocardioides sp. B-3]|uniref:AEC family transporter n=1 Tax=Nocardioides sp. B-3 TaxID=2895565 RepID=UPI0021538DFF|nr:AEC family transporter [Nocardioides sp. B-3]UUZ61479.1 AEC family transporter [Nocardioides sp. B-3]
MDLLIGFTTIPVVIACGAALAHVGVLDARSQRTLGEIAFFVASPALMVVVISEVEISGAVANFGASATAPVVAFASYAALVRRRWRQDAGSALIGALSASYANAGNLGIAVAAFVVGDTTVAVPTLLVQMMVVQPVSLMLLDRLTGRGVGAWSTLRRLVTNPLTVASVVGVTLAVTGWELPRVVDSPVRLLAGLAIPAMLLSYGAALRLSPWPGRAGHNGEVLVATVLKMVVMPLVARLVGSDLGLQGHALLGVVIMAALPTAQNIFLHATRYRTGEDVARETILVTTLCSLPVALLIAVLLG